MAIEHLLNNYKSPYADIVLDYENPANIMEDDHKGTQSFFFQLLSLSRSAPIRYNFNIKECIKMFEEKNFILNNDIQRKLNQLYNDAKLSWYRSEINSTSEALKNCKNNLEILFYLGDSESFNVSNYSHKIGDITNLDVFDSFKDTLEDNKPSNIESGEISFDNYFLFPFQSSKKISIFMPYLFSNCEEGSRNDWLRKLFFQKILDAITNFTDNKNKPVEIELICSYEQHHTRTENNQELFNNALLRCFENVNFDLIKLSCFRVERYKIAKEAIKLTAPDKDMFKIAEESGYFEDRSYYESPLRNKDDYKQFTSFIKDIGFRGRDDNIHARWQSQFDILKQHKRFIKFDNQLIIKLERDLDWLNHHNNVLQSMTLETNKRSMEDAYNEIRRMKSFSNKIILTKDGLIEEV